MTFGAGDEQGAGNGWFFRGTHVQTLIIHKPGFNQSYRTFTFIILITIVLGSNFPWTKFTSYKCFQVSTARRCGGRVIIRTPTRNQKPEARPETGNPKLETWNLKPETRNLKPETQQAGADQRRSVQGDQPRQMVQSPSSAHLIYCSYVLALFFSNWIVES